jgi:hypothetical protein
MTEAAARQLRVRVKCDEATFHQRCGVDMVDYPSSVTTVIGRPPVAAA